MTRKPKAIKLNSDKSEAEAEAEAEVKPKPKAKTKAKTKSHTKSQASSSARSPQAFPVPAHSEQTYDAFDQTPFQDEQDAHAPDNHLPDINKRIGWVSIFLFCFTTLISISIYYWVNDLIQELLERNPIMGWVSLGLAAVAGLCLLALFMRELISMMRLKKLENIRHDAEQVLLGEKPATKTISRLTKLYASRPDMKWQLNRLQEHADDIMDDPDRIKLSEQILMAPLDKEARNIIAQSAKRISIITALNPSAVLDILFVAYQVLQMLRKLMALYGGKPAFFGALKLVRMVATHLAVTGSLAISDTVLQQFIGKGLAGKLSTKLGEGTINGILAARIGLATIDICRPLPFSALEKPTLKSFLGRIFGGGK